MLVFDPYKEYVDLAVQVSSLADAGAYMRRAPNWKIAYHNRHLNADFEPVCRGLMAVGGNCLFIIEEADWFCTTKTLPPAFEEIIKYGRATVSWIVSCRNPSELPILIRSQASEISCFALLERAHVEWVSSVVDPEFADGINKLPPAIYHWQDLLDRTHPWERRTTDAAFRSRPRQFIRQG